ncbi:uncharacterized membrane protein YvlD (DUF360 family) [Acholeplasma morum]|uniref:phage holin family protein n=1 Tax=Paracholeplasma morum TaxID=264637 RepID=UPI00195AAFAA|nr:phage holin family protein [Paracholeplasma morum]MBM7453170.1 uncharacterized membrane protein YvlD (DUF360 family) [Paracholeplasma morum]
MKKNPLLVEIDQSYGYSMLRVYVFNLIAFMTAIGLTSELKVDHIVGFVILTILYTLVEFLLINVTKRFLFKYVIKTLGLLLLLIYIVLIYLAVEMVPDVRFTSTLGFVLFTLVFLVIKILLVYYYDKFVQSKRRHL